MKILQDLGIIDREAKLPSQRDSRGLTSEALQAIDDKIGYSEALESSQKSLINSKFKNVDHWYCTWNEEVQRIKGD